MLQNQTIVSYEEDEEIAVIATALYQSHGFEQAMTRIDDYINAASNESERREWQRIASEISSISATDHKTIYFPA